MARPIPIAVRLATDVTLRGHEWSEDGMTILFVHDLGEDLDVWGSVPATLAKSGFRVVSVELRGHGLSDGEPDPSTVVDDMLDLVAEVAGSFGPVAVVLHGSVSEAAFSMDASTGAPVHVVISPQPLSPDGMDWNNTSRAMRIVMVGAKNPTALEYAEGIYPKLQGQNLWVSTGAAEQGPELLREHPNLIEQIAMFVRRYLTGHHLAWIASHADEIKAGAAGEDET